MINKISVKRTIKRKLIKSYESIIKISFSRTNTRAKRRSVRLIRRIHISTNIFCKYRHAPLSNQFPRILLSLVAHPFSPLRGRTSPSEKRTTYTCIDRPRRDLAILPVVGSGRRRRRKTRGMPGTRKEQGFSRRIPVAHTERQNLIRLALKQPAKKGINAIPISRTD